MNSNDKQTELLRAKLNLETSQMPWKELERYFAGGKVIVVSDTLDLIDVAAHIANDDKDQVAGWIDSGRISRVSDELATAWSEADASLWTVVVKPWILVQMRAS